MRSPLAFAGVFGVAMLLAAAAPAQDFTGSYALSGSGGGTTITLTLRQTRTGRITGTLQGNTAFRVEGRARGDSFTGYASNASGRVYLQGRHAGDGLEVSMAEVGADGQPQLTTARTVTMARVVAAAPGAARAEPGRLAPGTGAKPGLAAKPKGGAPVAPQAASDPYAGTFSGDGLTLTLQRSGDGYSGSATSEGVRYGVRAQRLGEMLSGTYVHEGETLPFQAYVQGDMMQLAAAGETYTLRRQAAGAAGAGGAGAARGGGAGALGASAEDRQTAQLLVSHEWCTMTYSGGVGSTSGTTRYERLVFRPDGTGSRRTSSETYSSGDAGIAAGQGSGGGEYQWRVEGGALVSSSDGAEWVRTPMRLSRNSNGYPIITANGKDYAICD